jgi:hypothetical protein
MVRLMHARLPTYNTHTPAVDDYHPTVPTAHGRVSTARMRHVSLRLRPCQHAVASVAILLASGYLPTLWFPSRLLTLRIRGLWLHPSAVTPVNNHHIMYSVTSSSFLFQYPAGSSKTCLARISSFLSAYPPKACDAVDDAYYENFHPSRQGSFGVFVTQSR